MSICSGNVPNFLLMSLKIYTFQYIFKSTFNLGYVLLFFEKFFDMSQQNILFQ